MLADPDLWLITKDAKDYQRVRAKIDNAKLMKGSRRWQRSAWEGGHYGVMGDPVDERESDHDAAESREPEGRDRGEPIPIRASPGSVSPSLFREQSWDDTDLAWGDRSAADDGDRLSRDRPPHWE